MEDSRESPVYMGLKEDLLVDTAPDMEALGVMGVDMEVDTEFTEVDMEEDMAEDMEVMVDTEAMADMVEATGATLLFMEPTEAVSSVVTAVMGALAAMATAVPYQEWVTADSQEVDSRATGEEKAQVAASAVLCLFMDPEAKDLREATKGLELAKDLGEARDLSGATKDLEVRGMVA